MAPRSFLLCLFLALPLFAQVPCASTPTYSPCEFSFELSSEEAAQHPNPYLTVQLQAEFRSPRKRTFLMPAYWDGGRRLVIRFTPIEAGDWDYRLTSNLKSLEGKLGKFSATESASTGFVRSANGHHWANTETNKQHLWMGDTNLRFAAMDRALFEQFATTRAKQKFNHLRGLILGGPEDAAKAFPTPDQPNAAWFQEVDQRVLFLNKAGLTFDLIFAGGQDELAKLFPTWQQRERFVRYIVARYSPMNITWQGVLAFEEYKDGRPLMKELGMLLKKFDPFQHPRSTSARDTSAPLLPDEWMNYITYQSPDDQVGAIEHQLYLYPSVNAGFASEDSGAGKSQKRDVDFDSFRKRLWNCTMNGQYPGYSNTGTSGANAIPKDAKYLDSPGAKAMTAWFDFMSNTRYWELEPYFDVDGGRAVALEEIEYIVYIEKPTGPVELQVEQHSYDVYWFNTATGESIKMKNFKGEKFVSEPPDKTHDWILHLSRDGKKQSMLNSYKFESRPTPVQEVEVLPQKVPFEIVEPSAEQISLSKPLKFASKVKRDSRATRSMMYLWTADVPVDGQGYRVLATGANGTVDLDPLVVNNMAKQFPAILSLRVTAMNVYGKVYVADKVLGLVP